MVDKERGSVVVSDIMLKSAALGAAGAYMFRMGQNYAACYPEANILDAIPVFILAFMFWFLAGRIIIDCWVAPVLEAARLPFLGMIICRLIIVLMLATAMASILTVASASDGFLGIGEVCGSRLKVGPFPMSS